MRPAGAASHLDLFEQPASFSAPCSEPVRSIEDRYGFAGAVRALGGMGGHLGAPMSLTETDGDEGGHPGAERVGLRHVA